MLFFTYILILGLIFIFGIKRLKNKKISKQKAIIFYLSYSIIPILLYGIIFFILVGIEEVLNTSIIGEEYARSLFIVIIFGLIVTLVTTIIFSLVVLFMKK